MSYDSSGNEPFSLGNGKVIRETDKAILFENEDEKFWVPKSVIHDDSECWADADDKREGELVVKRWFAEKEGRT